MDKINSVLSVAKLVLLVSLVMLGVFSCTDSTSPDRFGNLTGTVILENDTDNPENDPLDFSGITIAIYNLATLDTTIVRINRQYPNIGVHISQETEFDHRLQNPIKVSQTHTDGTFLIENIPSGKYNLVALKQGWGYGYIYNIGIIEGSNSLSDRNARQETLTLYSEISLIGDVFDNVVVKEGRHLVIHRNSVFHHSSSLTLKPGSYLRIAANSQLDIMGNFSAQGQPEKMFKVTSNDRVNKLSSTNNRKPYQELESNYIEPYVIILVYSTASVFNNSISWGVFTHSRTSIRIDKIPEIRIENCIAKSEVSGFVFTEDTYVEVENTITKGGAEQLNTGIYFNFTKNGTIHNNLSLANHTGIKIKDDSDPSIINNLSINSVFGIELYDSNSEVMHNELINNSYGMRICGRKSPKIEKNYISSEVSILIGHSNYYPHPLPYIHYNNIRSSRYYYQAIQGTYGYINCQNNYYYTTDLNVIDSMIRDKYDYPEEYQNGVAVILFEPILNSPVDDAGVQR